MTTINPGIRAITARFGGRDVTFAIPPKRVEVFSLASRSDSLYGLFQRFAAGVWTIRELTELLRFAYEGRGDVRPNAADAVLEREPPALYAPLAARVLEAYLLGVEPRLATWSELEPFGSDRAAA